MTQATQADPPRRPLPRRQQHHRVERPASGSQIDFDSFVHLAQTAERGKFDFLFLAEGLRLREQNGRDLRPRRGRPPRHASPSWPRSPPSPTDSGSPAPSTRRSTSPTRWPASSPRSTTSPAGRAGWNVVTSWDAFTGENFRRGGFLAAGPALRARREFLAAARELFDSWRGDEIVADKDSGTFLRRPRRRRVRAPRTTQFDISGQFNVPRSPQGRPVIFQAGDSDEGREFAAAAADAIFTRHGTLEAGQAFYADVKGRLASYGRRPRRPVILPAATFVLGDTDAEAARARPRGPPQQVSGADRDQVPRAAVEPRPVRLRPRRPAARRRPGRRREHHRPGPGQRPDVPRPARHGQRVAGAGRGRETCRIRELVIEVTGRQNFIGIAEHRRRRRSTTSCRPTPATASSSSRTSPRAGSTSSPTRSCRCCRSAACSAPSTRAPLCATTSGWRSPHPPSGPPRPARRWEFGQEASCTGAGGASTSSDIPWCGGISTAKLCRSSTVAMGVPLNMSET